MTQPMTSGPGRGLRSYLEDPFLAGLLAEIKAAGPMKSCLVDMTHKCNLRCRGCYYFSEGMDAFRKVRSEGAFDDFVTREAARGTNLVTAVGGEPALEIERLRKLAARFQLVAVTNGTLPVPRLGLEKIRLGISFWGNEEQDVVLRGNGKKGVFEEALQLYRNDPRAVWYYTVVPGHLEGIEEATARMISNGNRVSYSFYGDLSSKGGRYSHTLGFEAATEIIERMVTTYPTKVLSSPYVNRTITRRQMFDEEWGFQVCPSVTFDHPENAERMRRGRKYIRHFRAYNADLQTTRRCCVGQARDCDTCTDLWASYGWITGSMRKHLLSEADFTNWLGSTYLFYLLAGFIQLSRGEAQLPELYRRLLRSRPARERRSMTASEKAGHARL